MDMSKLVVILEKVRDNLGVVETPEQSKPSEIKKASTAAAKAKLKELEKMSKAGRSGGNEITATGASRGEKK